MVKPMELFLKAGPEGTEIGDCPFAHYVRMVLAAKGVDYVATPCVQETKPQWLVDGYGERWGRGGLGAGAAEATAVCRSYAFADVVSSPPHHHHSTSTSIPTCTIIRRGHAGASA